MKLKITFIVLAIAFAAGVYVLVMQSGGKEKNLGGVPVGSADKVGDETVAILPISQSHSNEVLKIESEIRQVGKVLDFKGHDAELWGFGVLRRIEAISDYQEQRRLANVYLDAMEHLEPLDSCYVNTTRSLYNMVLLWPTFTAVQSRVDDPERPYKLMYKTLLCYRQAIQDVSKDSGDRKVGKAPRVQQDKIRQLRGELKTWGNVALNAYLPSAQKCNLPQERHAYWKMRIEAIMREEDPTSLR